jgi:hypothetical protein
MFSQEIKNLKLVAQKITEDKVLEAKGREFVIMMEITANKFVIPCKELYCNENQIEEKIYDLYSLVKEKIHFEISCRWKSNYEKTMNESMNGFYNLKYETYLEKPLYGVLNPEPKDSNATIDFTVKNDSNKTIQEVVVSEKV